MTDPAQPGTRGRLPAWMVILCIVVGICALVAPIGVRYYREQRAIRYIEAACGHINVRRGGPNWLRRRVGDKLMEVFDQVSKVTYFEISTAVTDADLVHLRGLTKLEQLYISRSGVTDAGLVHLHGLTQLEALYLDGTDITDARLVHLHGMTKLKTLDLSGPRITDAGLAHLSGLATLKELNLYGTRLTDLGLVHLRTLTNLETLPLRGTRVSENGVRALLKVLPHCWIGYW